MTKDAAKSGKAVGLAVAGWPLRRKMALALAVPLLLALFLGGWRVQGDYAESSNASKSAKQVQVLDPAVRYLTAAETAMVAAQSKSTTSQGDLLDAVNDLADTANELDKAADESELTNLQRGHVTSLLELSQAARGADAAQLGPATWVSLVRQVESGVSQLISSINAAQDTPEPRLEQLSQTISGRLSLAMQQAKVAGNSPGQSASQDLYSEIGVEAAAIDRMAGSIEGMDEETAALRTANTQHAAQIRDGSATNLGGRDAYLPYDAIIEDLLTGVEADLNDAAAAARNSALINALIVGALIAGAVFLALFITRLLLEPIGRVREGALSVARQKLPDAVARIRAGEQPQEIQPIDVHTDEEIGQVARAVDDLHRQAIHLASGEAQLRQTVNAMFVTLSRRSNSLVNQQLAQIERLEQNEEDPKRLESLFRLDHLASRMRRTADSLLILADAPNRAGGFSLTVSESLQAATSGVQDYQRVQILSHLGTQISEEAATDVVHLLTELVDNALTFSPPSEMVKLDASLDADGATITVTDSGLGVPDSELAQLNNDLAHGSEATPDTARRMGLFVVSRLSERHGIQVSLAKNPGGGMTATVRLPATVLPELPQPSARSASRVAAPAPSATEPGTTASATTAAVPAVADADAEQSSRRRSRSSRKGVDKAAAKQAKADKQRNDKQARADKKQPVDMPPVAAPPATRPSAADLLRQPEVTPDRPPLETLVPRREPGANMPRTGADAFLPPETSTATGPLFGKRSTPATPASEPQADKAVASPADEETAPEQPSTPTGLAEGAEKVASVVPITALAARQRQQVEEQAPPAEEPAAEEPVAEEPAAEEPAAEEPAAEEPAAEEPAAEEPAAQAPVAEPELDENDPLGLGLAAPTEPAVEEPAAGLPTPGLPPTGSDSARNGGDSPIFKSMRSGWLAEPGEGEWHETEVDRGWERAEEVAEEKPVAAATSAGLPMRQPGERLVPGSVTPPTVAKARDPEAIRRRLQAHTAGVSRGRRAANSSSQHKEAGPA